MPTKPRYRVLIPSGIEYPTDPSIIKEIEAGGNPGFDRRRHKRAECGAVVDDSDAGNGAGISYAAHYRRAAMEAHECATSEGA